MIDFFKFRENLAEDKNRGVNEERGYIAVHVKKGTTEVHANTSYEAAKAAAKKWGLRSTSGIDVHLAEAKNPKVKEQDLEKGADDPCWDGYVQVGTKMKDGKEVPNCVPMDEAKKMKNEAKSVGAHVWKSAMDNPFAVTATVGRVSGERVKSFDNLEDAIKVADNHKDGKVTHNVSGKVLYKDGKKTRDARMYEETLTEAMKVSGYYRKDPKVPSNVNKLNKNSPLETLIHAYLEAAEIASNSDYGSTEYDFADTDMEYLSSILSKRGVSTRDLNKLSQKFEKDGKYPVIKESNIT